MQSQQELQHLTSAGGANVSAFISAKTSAEQERHNPELEAAAGSKWLDKNVQPLKGMFYRALSVKRAITIMLRP